eukprot:8006649-Alexandrium_andersonii.AAC.1
MSASLVGSEMCIRDRFSTAPNPVPPPVFCATVAWSSATKHSSSATHRQACLLYTSDAADDM